MTDQHRGHAAPSCVSRRVVLRTAAVSGVAVPMLAACGADEAGTTGATTASPDTTDPAPSNGEPNATGPQTGLVATSQVPVGGGVVLGEEEVVVTQPSEGKFVGYSAVCTHQGCLVNGVSDGRILCPCHGSAFSVEDGSVLNGPASAPLAEVPVAVQGDQVVRS